MAAYMQPLFMEPIHILGSGSVGLFWASSIRSAFPSYPLAVLFRPHHKQRILRSSMDKSSKRHDVTTCTMQNRRPRMANVPVEFIGETKHKRPIRNLILATKAYQAADAVESLLSRLRAAGNSANMPALRVFVLSNGALDIRENLQQMLALYTNDIPEPEWIMCTTTHGVIKEDENDGDDDEERMIHLTHVGNGRTFLGGCPEMAQLWDQSGLNAKTMSDPTSPSTSDQMEVFLWRKLAGNCFCNPLTALWQVTNGELMQHHEDAPRIRKQLISEISSVARAMNPTWHADAVSEVVLDSFVEQVIQDNLQNRSSMHYDVQRGRRTEVDSLNGYIVRKGEETGIDTPANQELLSRVREITSQG